MPRVKGSAFASRIRWVRLKQGEAGLDRLQREVSPELAAILRDGAVMAQWYPLGLFIEINVAIDRLFGAGDLSLIKQLGRDGADANLTTIYRLFFKVGTVKWIMARAARLWGVHYDSGRLVVTQKPGKEVDIHIENFEEPNCVHCLAVQGWIERSIELSGAREVDLQKTHCRTEGERRCTFRLTWQ